jgi:hypothetical protein
VSDAALEMLVANPPPPVPHAVLRDQSARETEGEPITVSPVGKQQ